MNSIQKFISIFLFTIVFLLCGNSTVFAAPPENFQVSQIIGNGLEGPSGFEIAPDGRIFILERTGSVKIVKDGQLLPTPFAELPSIASGDRGLIGIAFDPEFGINNHYVYFYYTGTDMLNRVVRFSAEGDIGTNGPYVLYQTNSPSQTLHVGGSIGFGPDGKLYFAVGDNGYPPNAQNLGNPHGKILRINKDGSVPLDNPFYGQPGAMSEIWAYGMRNPWRFQFDSVTGNLYGGDVGDYTWEEVNHISQGKNYGWPSFEGYCNALCGTTTTPIFAYNHNGDSAAITGGPVYRGTSFPEEYHGNLFFGDYAKGMIQRLTLDETGNATGVYDFDMNAGSVVDLKVAPDGALYYITYWPGRLYKITYATDNHIPTANATSDVSKGVEPLLVQFSSTGSLDPDGDPITFLWNFGDGTTSTDPNPTKMYTQKGVYTVDLTVSDGVHTGNAVPIAIQVGTPPQLTIGEPTEGNTYRAGDIISYTAHAIDAAGFDMNDGDIKTEILLHHDTHVHPFLGPLTGRAGSFTIPDHGEAAANTWYEIRITVTDDSGLTDTKSVNIYPIKSQMTFDSNVPGLTFMLDGAPHTTPHTVQGVEKFKREISAPTIQFYNGKYYQFESWSDNGAPRHTIITPQDDTTYTALFSEAPAYNAEYFNNKDLTGVPVITRQDAKIDFVWGDESPDPLMNTDNFSARWTKSQYFASGRYKFTTATDDGVRLFIDGQQVINEWHGNNSAFNATVDLTAGMHEIKMEYMDLFGLANARLEYELTPDQPAPSPASGYTAEYFNNKTLDGVPVLSRNDASINFDWGVNSPDPVITPDNFSVRWTKVETITPANAGDYEFAVTGDDGVRIVIDGEVILNKWIDQGPTTYKAIKNLTAGTHTIIVEYYENGGGAVAQFNYNKVATTPPPTDSFIAEYFVNKTLSGTPVVTKSEPMVNFDWAAGSPDPLVPANNFSARWTKSEIFTAGNYEFSITGDDGIRLLIDGTPVIDKFIDQGATTYKVTKDMTAGEHTIIIEYYESGGDAVAKFSYVPTTTTPPPASGFAAEYFNNKDLLTPVTLTRTDATIDFDWAGGSPDPLINANNFSARWSKTENIVEAGDYEFTVTADDGIRVKIDNEVIIDKFIDQGPTTYKAIKNLNAGDHIIVIEYYENGGGAVAKFNFAKSTQLPPPNTNCPADWICQDVGAPGISGSTVFTNNIYTLKGSGTDIWGIYDMFHFANKAISGDATIVAKVTSQTDTHEWAKAGVMMKESNVAGSQYVSMSVTPRNGYTMEYNFNNDINGGTYTFPNAWVKLTRAGNIFNAYTSIDGVIWNQVGSTTLPMNPDMRIGLFITSNDNNALGTATFENVSVTPGAN